jgi:hypothetical protein
MATQVTPPASTKTGLASLQPYTKYLPIVVAVVVGVFNILLAQHVFSLSSTTADLINGLLATVGFGSLHINSLN